VDLMQSHGYIAEAFDSGAAFLNSSRRYNSDCLIADIHMPDMTGLELGSRIAASDRPIPTILITARHDENVRKQAMQIGVLCYFPKPFAEEELINCIRAAYEKGDVGGGAPPPG
jgi:FixJ family two-component response regulator